jgi:hypothetical protein
MFLFKIKINIKTYDGQLSSWQAQTKLHACVVSLHFVQWEQVSSQLWLLATWPLLTQGWQWHVNKSDNSGLSKE